MSSSRTPVEASIDYSLLQDIMSSSEQFDQAYFTEPYHTSPDYPLDPFLDIDSFSPTVPSIEMPTTNPAAFPQPTSPFNTTPLNQSGPSHASPASQVSSRTSSLSGSITHHPIPPPPATTTHSPSLSLSPRNLKRESPSSPPSFPEPPPKRSHQQEKQVPRPARQPHNQVERKYREGLNAALERLRRAVPLGEGSLESQAKISKATILTRAIEHIKIVEAERDALREENERLRAGRGSGSGNGRGLVWTGGEDLMEGFVMDY